MRAHTTIRKPTIAKAVVFLFLISTITAGITMHGGAQQNTYEVCESGCDFAVIQTAIDVAQSGDTVLVGAGTYEEKLHIPQSKTGLRLLAQEPGTVTVDPSDEMSFGTILFVRADDVIVRGFNLVWNGTSDSNVHGLWISGDGVRIEENTIRLTGSTQNQFKGIHINRASDIRITDNSIESDLFDLEEQTPHTANGIYVQGGTPAVGEAKDIIFRGNTFTGWATHAMFLNGAEASHIDENAFSVNNEGILLCNTKDTRVTHNTFEFHFTGIHLCDTVQDPVLHKNTLGATNEVALFLDDRIESTTVDARLNDWGLYEVGLLDQRVDDQGTGNEILQVPFLDALGAAEPPLVRIQDRPDEPYFTVQDALDASLPGDTVLVPASGDALEPLVREETLTITTPEITFCSSIGGSPLCAEAHEAGHWQVSRGQWVPSPTHGHGWAVLLDDAEEEGTWGSTSFFPADGFEAHDLEALSLDLFLEEPTDSGPTCGAGSPRIALAVDADENGERDGTINIVNTDLQSGCETREWIFADFMDEASTEWSMHSLGGPNGVSQAQALSWITNNLGSHEIVAINAIMDNGASAILDNQRINNQVLGEEQDIACYWAQGEACRWDETRARTVLDAQGAPATLSVDAADVSVHGFTIKNSAEDVPLSGVVLQGDDAVLRDNDIAGNFSPLEQDGSPTVNQVGVELGAAGARGIRVTDNLIRDWDNIGVYLEHSAGSGNEIHDNNITGSRWHGILAEGPTADVGEQSAAITDNTIRDHGHSALRLGMSDPGVLLVRGNAFALTNLNALTIQERVEDTTIDVRLNDWGLYDPLTLGGRVDDESGTNEVLQIPFLDATGAPEPPLVQRVQPDSPDQQPDLFLSFQEAIDDPDSVPGTRIQALPARTPYPGPIDLDRSGITLCGTQTGSACDGDPAGTILGGGALDRATLTIHDAEGIAIEHLTLQGGSPVIDADASPGLTLRENVIASDANPTSASHGIRINDTTDARVESNQITGNLYPGSRALGFAHSDDALAKANRIEGAATSIHVLEGEGARIENNEILSSPSPLAAGETIGIELAGGTGHVSTKNTVYGAGTGLLNRGSTDAASEADRFLASGTGVGLRTQTVDGPAQQPEGFRLNDASLAGTTTGLQLASGTNGLEVDARCNDWGAYSASLIQRQRITDDGTGNDVQFTPYVAPAPDGPLSAPGCLNPPVPGFSFLPEAPTAGEPIQFTDNSTEGSRPIVEKHWDFGDGTSLTDQPPFEDPTHTYGTGGTYVVTLRLTDSDGNEATELLPVPAGKQPPQIVAPFEKNARAGDLVKVPVSAFELDGSLVTLSANGLPGGAQLGQNETIPSQWEILWTPGTTETGTFLIELVATGSEGATTTHILTLLIRDALPEKPDLSVARQGVKPGPAIPNQPLTFQSRLVNNEDVAVELELEATTVAGWATAIHGPEVITLEPGEERIVKFDVIIGNGTASSSFVYLLAGAPGATEEEIKQVGWNIKLPVETEVVLSQTSVGDDIQGTASARFLDGSPAVNRPVRIEHTYSLDPLDLFTSNLRGDTDENGVYRFTFPASDEGTQLPGTHRLIADIYSPDRERTELEYTIGTGL